MRLSLIYLQLLLCTSHLHTQNTNDLYLGVLETRFVSFEDTTRIRVQRVMFRHANDKWYSLEHEIGDSSKYPVQAPWTIAFDGRTIGSFNSHMAPIKFRDAPWTFPRDAYHIPDTQKLPTIGMPTMEFSGWIGEIQPRPLVTVSDTNYADREKWKPFVPDERIIKELTTLYKQHFEYTEYARIDTLSDVILALGKSYISANGGSLIQIGEKNFLDDGAVILSSPIWIYRSSAGEVIDLSKAVDFPFRGAGDSETSNLHLVDAGDYDGDGYSEVIFWIDRYNGNGYALFYHNFSAHVTFEWSFH